MSELERTNLKKLRTKQVTALNVMIVLSLVIFFFVLSTFAITARGLFLAVGIIGFIQSAFQISRLRSSKIIIPILDEVAQYEKEKMGPEWFKLQRVSIVFSLIFSVIFILLAFFMPPTTGKIMPFDFIGMMVFSLILIVMINASLLSHMKKVDNAATTPADFKGYTMKVNLKAVLGGIGMAVLLIIFVVMNVASRI